MHAQAEDGLLWSSVEPHAVPPMRSGGIRHADIAFDDAEIWGRETARPFAPAPEAPSTLRSRIKRFTASFDERAAIFGSCGFVLGVIAWHMVGFWSFVSDVVLHDPQTAQSHIPVVAKVFAAADGAPASTAAAPVLTTGSIGSVSKRPVETDGACAALEFDRASGLTRRVSCTPDARVFKDAGFQHRSDRAAATPLLQNSQVWASATQTKSEQVEAPSPAPADFDLTIKTDR